MGGPDEHAPTRLEVWRGRHPWLDHLVRAGVRYTERHGDHYAAAITYFSVLAVVPLLMIAFAVAGHVLFADEQLLAQLRAGIAQTVPSTLVPLVNSIVDTAIEQGNAIGIIGLVIALYAGLGWMTNLREALSAQWDQHGEPPPLVRRYGLDLLAMLGLGLALAVSFAIAAGGTLLSDRVLELLGLAGEPVGDALVVVVGLALTLVANWLVLVWVLARLPRQPVPVRGAARAAVLGAGGLVVLQQVMTVYLGAVTSSPTWAAFGPILGLLLFANVVSRFLLLVTAWAATAPETEPVAAPEPAPVVVRPAVTVVRGPSAGATAGLVGLGAVLGAVGGALRRRR
ncbi:YhjD/YihY/BrkB family envelope integrity protein [Actinomycetospora sp. TBRC 11914]|uniref:YhjD/YihY/BrkB family envelope integrity protein n=1 Tax=Actinomycetospora sp. TBRC 11914 TaxID=2729387 RepID=UPI00145EE7D7|nr:YhjD/YihY/BrkB family envelope integrity protein [Actinomycetospora sp. TBRC 11914]NMO89795.1 inner membrane protein YhjD [Actinomycetospora sp. TBRC 11914]